MTKNTVCDVNRQYGFDCEVDEAYSRSRYTKFAEDKFDAALEILSKVNENHKSTSVLKLYGQ